MIVSGLCDDGDNDDDSLALLSLRCLFSLPHPPLL